MSYTYHGTTDLVALPNRTVQTYPSGLVRVERSFVCRKAQVARFRNTIKVNEPMPFDDGAPAIDGLYIFPEPQEIVRDDGFVEFRVTAYGRTSTTIIKSIEKSTSKSEYYILDYRGEGEPKRTSLPSINDIFIIRGVIASSLPTTSIMFTPNASDLFVYDITNRSVLIERDIFIAQQIKVDDTVYNGYNVSTVIGLRLDSYQSTNFGFFSEYAIIWQAIGTVTLTLGNAIQSAS